MDKPAVGPMLMAARHGFTRLHSNHQGGFRNKRVPLPAATLQKMVALGQTTADPGLRRRVARLTLTALTFSRPGSGANLRRKDVTLTPSLMLIQIPDYKHGARNNRERLVIRVPRRAAGLHDGAWDLVHKHITAMRLATAYPDQPLFTPDGNVVPLPTEVATAWIRDCLYLLNITPPDGCIYSGHSLRGCAATSARSIGCELDPIATLMGMKDKDTTTVSANYVDALAQPDVQARELYDRYRVDRRSPASSPSSGCKWAEWRGMAKLQPAEPWGTSQGGAQQVRARAGGHYLGGLPLPPTPARTQCADSCPPARRRRHRGLHQPAVAAGGARCRPASTFQPHPTIRPDHSPPRRSCAALALSPVGLWPALFPTCSL